MGVEYLEDHEFKGQIIRVNDTPENRIKYQWYFKNQYHHYRFDCKGVYTNGNHNTAHTYCHGVIEGMEKNKLIEAEMRAGERMNMQEGLMCLAYPENRLVKHKLIKFKEEDDEEFFTLNPRRFQSKMVSSFLLNPEGE